MADCIRLRHDAIMRVDVSTHFVILEYDVLSAACA
jgi:hypothetical protein